MSSQAWAAPHERSMRACHQQQASGGPTSSKRAEDPASRTGVPHQQAAPALRTSKIGSAHVTGSGID